MTPEQTLQLLAERGLVAKNIEFTQVGSFYFANLFSYQHSLIITDTVFTGFASEPKLALSKAISEMIERKAFEAGYENGVPACQSQHSDGFAAFPRRSGSNEDPLRKVREIALNEATERYVWATWWDKKTEAQIQTIPFDEIRSMLGDAAFALLGSLNQYCEYKEIIRIRPTVVNSDNYTILFFVRLKNAGFISGGACDSTLFEATSRALSELYRHGLAWVLSQKKNLRPATFYEKRLILFASGNKNELVFETIHSSLRSSAEIKLPRLIFDTEISHSLSDMYICYRCLFENQPPFVGGDLARLCL